MQIRRRLAAFLLLAYLALVAGYNFHFHPQGQNQATLHCKLCELSQTYFEKARISTLEIVLVELGILLCDSDSFSRLDLIPIRSGRAPPSFL